MHAITIADSIGSQFAASLDMLENAINMCPDEHWDTELDFWYAAYHCIFWTDYYLTTAPDTFAPPQPFTLSEFTPTGDRPERSYTKDEVLAYLGHCRSKAGRLIGELTAERLQDRWMNAYKDYSLLEILLYNMRHIQHHAAQLNLLLRQTINMAPAWVAQGAQTDAME